MTRKRFIKLLMGRYGYDRNAARQDAQLKQDYTHQRDLTNRAAKAWGYSIRLPLHGYAYTWKNAYEPLL